MYGAKYNYLRHKIHTSLDDAVHQINVRRRDFGLIKEIEAFLGNDIPEHFKLQKPIFYLSRHLATPDYETLLFARQVKPYNLPVIIGEDTTDILNSRNALKRNLMKMPVMTGHSKDGSAIMQHHRIGDLNEQQGKRLDEVTLLNGGSLVEFHHALGDKLLPKYVMRADESMWVSKHGRGKLSEIYENILALLITHGIMLEFYEYDEADFIQEIVLPAFKKNKARFGYSPLIAPLQQPQLMNLQDVNSYPKSVRLHIEQAGLL